MLLGILCIVVLFGTVVGADRNATCERMMLPTVYLSHGGGPMPLLGEPSHAGIFFLTLNRSSSTSKCSHSHPPWPIQLGIIDHFRSLAAGPLQGVKPKAILVISAHWSTSTHTVTTHPTPPMLYDYYGFPPETYKYQYTAPGSPEIAQRVKEALDEAGIQTEGDPNLSHSTDEE